MKKYQEALNRILDDDYDFPHDFYGEDKATTKERDTDIMQELVDKATLKKPNIWGDGYDDKGQLIYDMYDCPNCDKTYELDYEKYDYCPKCGQAIDWSDENE